MALTPGKVTTNDGTPASREQAFSEAVDHLISLKGTGVEAFVGAVKVGNDVHVVGVGDPLGDLPPLIKHLAEGLRAAVFKHFGVVDDDEDADDGDGTSIEPFGRPDEGEEVPPGILSPSTGTKH